MYPPWRSSWCSSLAESQFLVNFCDIQISTLASDVSLTVSIPSRCSFILPLLVPRMSVMLCIGVFLWCCVAFQECLFPHWMWFLRCGDDSDGKGLVTQHEHWILDSHYPCKSHCGEVASLKFQLSEGWNIEASFSSQISQTSEFNWESLPQWIQWGATEEGSHYKPLALQASISNFYQCLHTRASVFTHMETCMTYACMSHTQIIEEKIRCELFLTGSISWHLS